MLERLTGTVQIYKDVVKERCDWYERASRLNDSPPLDVFAMAKIGITTLEPKMWRAWKRNVSSLYHGRWVFNQVFPKSENPVEYTSTEAYISICESPVQVLGWAETDALIEQGVQEGLDGNWIRMGFDRQAQLRGISLEWSFFQYPPSHQPESVKRLSNNPT